MVPHPPMIVPAVGRGSEGVVAETTRAYEKVADEIAGLRPDTIIISSPHSVMYADYFHISPGGSAKGSFSSFGAPQVRMEIRYDEEFVSALCQEARIMDISAGTLGQKDRELDHGTMVPLYFILQRYTDFKLVRIGLSGLPMEEHYRMGMAIGQVAGTLGRRAVYVASGDLSHKLKDDGPYGFDPSGPVYDDRIMEVMGEGDFGKLFSFDENLLEKAAECGHRSFVMMAGALDRRNVVSQRLSHQDVTGVGYGICTYSVLPDDRAADEDRAFLAVWEKKEADRRAAARAKEDAFVRLARLSLEEYIRNGRVIGREDALRRIGAQGSELEELEKTRAGAFVSLHKQGQLRGCIGTIAPVRECVADEIIENAVSAAVHDSRFLPVEEVELGLIEYSVDVLDEAESIDSESELDVKRYGVIVTKGMKRGLLLPNLDGVDTIEQQVSIAKRKAGLAPDEKGCSLERFEVVRHY